MLSPATTILTGFIALVAMSMTLPSHIVTKCVTIAIMAGAAYKVVRHSAVSESTEGAETDTLHRHVSEMMSSGYEKNNEDVPLRRIKRFRYIYLDTHMVALLVELFQYEARYKDVVYSTVYYSEAFMRQVFRMMEGKVRDAHQARTLAERLLNHLHTLMYNASKYEIRHIEDLTHRFTKLVWGLYRQTLERIGEADKAHAPSAVDPWTNDRFDLQLL